MRILALSPYPAHSHRIWLDQLIAGFPDIEWRVLELPARHFQWRIRSNPLDWYLRGEEPDAPAPDLVLATSMTDVAAFRGVFHRQLGAVPFVVYFHENQFAYPVTPGATESVEPAMVNLYNALAADRVVFNSHYNRRTFLAGAEAFLARMPDKLPVERLVRIVEAADVIPVPVRGRFFQNRAGEGSGPARLIWNHRWEHDKGPDRLLAAVDWLAEQGAEFELVLAGQRFREIPAPLQALRERFVDHIAVDGFLDDDDYAVELARGGLVVSTALHDFQGLSVLEAVAAGCVPVVPDRVAYPEWFDERYLYPSHPEPAEDGRRLGRRILEIINSREPLAAPSVAAFRFEALAGCYRRLFNDVHVPH